MSTNINQLEKFANELNEFDIKTRTTKKRNKVKNQFYNDIVVYIRNFEINQYSTESWKVFKFGSSVWDIDNMQSDIDIAINLNCDFPQRHIIQNILQLLSKQLKNSNSKRSTKSKRKLKILKILHASCPIIIVEDTENNMKIDICIADKYTLQTKELISSEIDKYEKLTFPIKKLIKFIKYWSKQRGINNAKICFPNSFGWTIMVITFFKSNYFRLVLDKCLILYNDDNVLCKLIYRFMLFYSTIFNAEKHCIAMNIKNKNKNEALNFDCKQNKYKNAFLEIIDPSNPSNNVARAVQKKQLKKIKSELDRARILYKQLIMTKNEDDRSLFHLLTDYNVRSTTKKRRKKRKKVKSSAPMAIAPAAKTKTSADNEIKWDDEKSFPTTNMIYGISSRSTTKKRRKNSWKRKQAKSSSDVIAPAAIALPAPLQDTKHENDEIIEGELEYKGLEEEGSEGKEEEEEEEKKEATKKTVQQKLVSMGLGLNEIQKLFQIYEKNYGAKYDTSSVVNIIEIIIQLQSEGGDDEKDMDVIINEEEGEGNLKDDNKAVHVHVQVSHDNINHISIGDRLYKKIQIIEPILAAKITGILLKSFRNDDLCRILMDERELINTINLIKQQLNQMMIHAQCKKQKEIAQNQRVAVMSNMSNMPKMSNMSTVVHVPVPQFAPQQQQTYGVTNNCNIQVPPISALNKEKMLKNQLESYKIQHQQHIKQIESQYNHNINMYNSQPALKQQTSMMFQQKLMVLQQNYVLLENNITNKIKQMKAMQQLQTLKNNGVQFLSNINQATTLNIKNVPSSWSNAKLRKVFVEFGNISLITRNVDNGTASVNFEDHYYALNAMRSLQLDKELKLEIKLQTQQTTHMHVQKNTKTFQQTTQTQTQTPITRHYNENNLYIANLPKFYTKTNLLHLFKPFGKISTAKMNDNDGKISSAFVRFADSKDAKRAVQELNGKKPKGFDEEIIVKLAVFDVAAYKKQASSIFVNNLSQSIDNATLYDIFSVFGNILSANIVMDSQKSLCCGYVHFVDAKSAQNAVDGVNRMKIGDREIHAVLCETNEASINSSPSKPNDTLTKQLEDAKPKERKRLIGERLFPKIKVINPRLAGKLTGMLLELDNTQLLVLLSDQKQLIDMINQALSLLEYDKSQNKYKQNIVSSELALNNVMRENNNLKSQISKVSNDNDSQCSLSIISEVNTHVDDNDYNDYNDMICRNKECTIYVVGLSISLCNEEILRGNKWFGRFGKIKNISFNKKHSESRIDSIDTFITYYKVIDATKAIETMNEHYFKGGRMLNVMSCSNICEYSLRNEQCDNKFCLLRHTIKAKKNENKDIIYRPIVRKSKNNNKASNDEKEEENEYDESSFEYWLVNIVRLPMYLPLFQDDYNDTDMIEFFDEDFLKNDLGIKKKIHIKLLLKRVEEYKNK